MLDKNIATSIRLLKGNDVARILNISRAFAYQLMRQGRIQPSGSVVRCVCVLKI